MFHRPEPPREQGEAPCLFSGVDDHGSEFEAAIMSERATIASQTSDVSRRPEPSPSGNWLIIGHGTVGSVLRSRVLAAGGSAWIYDPQPRLAIPTAEGAIAVGPSDRVAPDAVALCVPATAGAAASAYLREHVDGHPVVYDWASDTPATKIANANGANGAWIDVALLDSLDRGVGRALLAISGPEAATAGDPLHALGFDVLVAGESVGDAAAVKLTRSLFMKSLEALVVEFRAMATRLDPSDAAWNSIERSLGRTFADFADVLVSSNAVHAGRRSVELRHALTFAAEHGTEAVVADAAWDALARLAEHWAAAAPDPQPSVHALLVSAEPLFRR